MTAWGKERGHKCVVPIFVYSLGRLHCVNGSVNGGSVHIYNPSVQSGVRFPNVANHKEGVNAWTLPLLVGGHCSSEQQ